jgi:hypothetical protein
MILLMLAPVGQLNDRAIPAGDRTLTASMGEDGKELCAYASAFTIEKVGQDRRTVTTTFTSHLTMARLFFSLPHTSETGSVRPASKKTMR